MINQPIQVLKLLYLALQEEWELTKDSLLGQYLSEADPFVVGDDSVDPVIFEDFLSSFEKYGTYEEYGYNFILKYLSDLDPYYGDLKQYFLNIDKQKYIKESEKYSQLSDKEIIELKHWEKYYRRIYNL